ncbi:uncharacterized protein [Hyperolius riggenbachi]|uniref:uncharacterized protein n=1 Tax=Hyperolius riggenbachi TaxID=752182 RepID=UPI0035A38E4F
MDPEALARCNQMCQIFEQAYNKDRKKGKPGPGYTVGIVTSQLESEIAGVLSELKRVSENMKEILFISTSTKGNNLDRMLSMCTFYIYICDEQKWKFGFSAADKEKTFSLLGKKKVLVVLIIDMEDSSEEQKAQIKMSQPNIGKYVREIFLLRKKPEYPQGMNKPEYPQGMSTPEYPQGMSTPEYPQGMNNNINAGAGNYYQVEPRGLRAQNITYPDPQGHPLFNRPQPSPSPVPGNRGYEPADMPQNPMGRRHMVGIFSRSGEQDYSWLIRVLKEDFQDCVVDVRNFYITNNGYQQLRDDISQCTFGIIYHTRNRGRVNITDVKESLYDEELQSLCEELGRKNVLVLIDDLDDSSDEEKHSILQSQPSIKRWSSDALLLSMPEKANRMTLMTKLNPLRSILRGEVFTGEKLRERMLNPANPEYNNPPPYPQQRNSPVLDGRSQSGNSSPASIRSAGKMGAVSAARPTVAIYSNSDENIFAWLSNVLSMESVDVRPHRISPHQKDRPQETAFRCKLVILYHSRKSGKLNLTDGKDALYHEELEMLSAKYGRRRLIVVVDDLDDSSDKTKHEIEKRHPSLEKFAAQVFLFSTDEKKHLPKLDLKKHKRTIDKIMAIKEMLNK